MYKKVFTMFLVFLYLQTIVVRDLVCVVIDWGATGVAEKVIRQIADRKKQVEIKPQSAKSLSVFVEKLNVGTGDSVEISGVVKDDAGIPLRNAVVQITDPFTNQNVKVRTDNNGLWIYGAKLSNVGEHKFSFQCDTIQKELLYPVVNSGDVKSLECLGLDFINERNETVMKVVPVTDMKKIYSCLLIAPGYEPISRGTIYKYQPDKTLYGSLLSDTTIYFTGSKYTDNARLKIMARAVTPMVILQDIGDLPFCMTIETPIYKNWHLVVFRTIERGSSKKASSRIVVLPIVYVLAGLVIEYAVQEFICNVVAYGFSANESIAFDTAKNECNVDFMTDELASGQFAELGVDILGEAVQQVLSHPVTFESIPSGAKIYIADVWGERYYGHTNRTVELFSGDYTVRYGDIPGYIASPSQKIHVSDSPLTVSMNYTKLPSGQDIVGTSILTVYTTGRQGEVKIDGTKTDAKVIYDQYEQRYIRKIPVARGKYHTIEWYDSGRYYVTPGPKRIKVDNDTEIWGHFLIAEYGGINFSVSEKYFGGVKWYYYTLSQPIPLTRFGDMYVEDLYGQEWKTSGPTYWIDNQDRVLAFGFSSNLSIGRWPDASGREVQHVFKGIGNYKIKVVYWGCEPPRTGASYIYLLP